MRKERVTPESQYVVTQENEVTPSEPGENDQIRYRNGGYFFKLQAQRLRFRFFKNNYFIVHCNYHLINSFNPNFDAIIQPVPF